MNGLGIFLMVVAVCFCISLVVIAGVLWRILVAQRAFRLKREQMRLDSIESNSYSLACRGAFIFR